MYPSAVSNLNAVAIEIHASQDSELANLLGEVRAEVESSATGILGGLPLQ
jgi:hypothetical protein